MNLLSTSLTESNPRGLEYNDERIDNNNDVIKFDDYLLTKEPSYYYNRVFVSKGDSYNGKYIIKYLTTVKTKSHNATEPPNFADESDDDEVISKEERVNVGSNFNIIGDIKKITDSRLTMDNNEQALMNIIDTMTAKEFHKLLEIEPKNRLKYLKDYYDTTNNIVATVPLDKLNKFSNSVDEEVAYDIYTVTENDKPIVEPKDEHFTDVNLVREDEIWKFLKSCGVVIIDVSRDNEELARGRRIFNALLDNIINAEENEHQPSNGYQRMCIVISTVMTWAGNNLAKKKDPYNVKNEKNRRPHPAFKDHFQFEKEVMTAGRKMPLKTIIVWSGITYGFEQDLLKFAFDSFFSNSSNFLIPKSLNYLPVAHVENLAKVVYKIMTESEQLKYNCIFSIDPWPSTLQQIIMALTRGCNAKKSKFVPLETFLDDNDLQGTHRHIISANMKIEPNIDLVWPKFEWYSNKSSIIDQMELLMEIYKIEHNIKNIKILVLGPPASGKTKLAHKLVNYYNVQYLEPNQLIDDYIANIRMEIMKLRLPLFVDSTDDVDLPEDVNTKEKIAKLEKELNSLYLSIDQNNGRLEDVHLIPFLRKRISPKFSTNVSYILDGYPTTVGQFKLLFSDPDSPDKMDECIMPELAICLKQNPLSQPLMEMFAQNDASIVETKSAKRRLMFSDINPISSSDPNLVSTPNIVAKATKPILKMSNSGSSQKSSMFKRRMTSLKSSQIHWNEQDLKNLLKMFEIYYIPIQTLDSPYPPLKFGSTIKDVPEADLSIEKMFNAVLKECKLNQHLFPGMLSPKTKVSDLETISKVSTEQSQQETERRKKLIEKMTILEEFERLTDFEHLENITSEEYLINYITPTLTKLFVQVAKVRPRNPLEFMAYLALKENPESMPHCPGYSRNGMKLQELLNRMSLISGDDLTSKKPLLVSVDGRPITDVDTGVEIYPDSFEMELTTLSEHELNFEDETMSMFDSNR